VLTQGRKATGDSHKSTKPETPTSNKSLFSKQAITMQSIIEMNNLAALLMENGLYKEALEVLDNILATQQEILRNDGQEALEHTSSATDLPLFQDSVGHPPRKPLTPVLNFESNDEDFIYRSPIRATELPEEDGGEDFDEFAMLVVIIFNMALSHHLRAIQGRKVDQTRLRKALKLYELSFCMQMKGGSQLSVTQVLALANNCGQIYKQLDRQRKANKFFQHMLSTLMAMIEGGEAEEVDELGGFMWNASRLILVDPALAPAA
jgi:tetratricopeptide (TPR) repeat protein